MTALLLCIAAFAGFTLLGLGVLTALRSELGDLRIVLVAPALGLATFTAALFLGNYAGAGVDAFVLPLTVGLLAGSAAILAWRRPAIHPGVLLVIAVTAIGVAIVVGPMVSFGLNWDPAGNDDMGNYSLSAQLLLHHALLAPYDVAGLRADRDYATVQQLLHNLGSRPGSDIALSGLSGLTGLLSYEVFQPLILAMQVATAWAAGSLSLQATKRWWAAPVAVALYLASPMANFGWLHQLLAQAAGLATATALVALLLDRELYHNRRPPTATLIPVILLGAGLLLSYIELASTVAVGIILWLAIALVRRDISVRRTAWIVIPALVGIALVINGYLGKEIPYVLRQASSGLGASKGPPVFGFSLVPAALAEVVGLRAIPGSSGFVDASTAIVIAGVLLVALLVVSARGALRRGSASATILIADAVLGVALFHNNSDFGLFKLYMYAQPFACAAVAAGLIALDRSIWRLLAAAGTAVLIAFQLTVLGTYLQESRNPVDLRGASATSLMPRFRHVLAHSHGPLISVTDNPTLAKIEAVSAGPAKPIYFVSTNVFGSFFGTSARSSKGRRFQTAQDALEWTALKFNLHDRGAPLASDSFAANPLLHNALVSPSCEIVLPTGSEEPLNRRIFPEGLPYLVTERCASARDQLVFTNSTLGGSYYGQQTGRYKSLWQLEPDPYFPGHTFAGTGRYLLFRVLGPTKGMRIEFNFTNTILHHGSSSLPPAALVGSTRTPLRSVGNGSERVFSAPVQPQMIDGAPYVLIDVGAWGTLPYENRAGLQGLWGKKVPLDYRYLTGWIRDVSLVSAAQYHDMSRPTAISSFPAGLDNPSLEYSGFYEDGWTNDHAYAVLAGTGPTDLVISGLVPPHAAHHLIVQVNGKSVYGGAVQPGALHVRVPLAASTGPRWISLEFSGSMRLSHGDGRPAAALLTFLGLVGRHQP